MEGLLTQGLERKWKSCPHWLWRGPASPDCTLAFGWRSCRVSSRIWFWVMSCSPQSPSSFWAWWTGARSLRRCWLTLCLSVTSLFGTWSGNIFIVTTTSSSSWSVSFPACGTPVPAVGFLLWSPKPNLFSGACPRGGQYWECREEFKYRYFKDAGLEAQRRALLWKRPHRCWQSQK